MKNIFLISLSVLILSCVPELKVIDSYESTVLIDFSRFSEKGFLFTPEKYNGNYESVGIVEFTIKPGAQYIRTGRKKNPNYRPDANIPMYIDEMVWSVEYMNWDNALDKVYDLCIKLDANALVNFNLKLIEDRYSYLKNPVTIRGYRITGFAIKRKDI